MTKSEKKKPTYSLISNIVYMLKTQYKASRLSVVLYCVLIVASTGASFFTIFLPKIVINSVINEITPYAVVLYVGLIGIGLIFCNGTSEWIKSYGAVLMKRITVELTALKTQKVLYTDYENLESTKCRDMLQKADEALWGTGEGSSAERMVKNTYHLLINVVGFALFGTVLSFASPWITLLLTILPVINYFVIVKIQEYQYKARDYTSALDRKLWYIAYNCGTFDGGKDVRIYGMNQWFLHVYRALTKERLNWSKRAAKKFFVGNILDAVIILLRDGFAYIFLIYMVLHNRITLDNFVFYFAAVGSFSGWVGGIIGKLSEIHATSLSICDLRDFLSYPEKKRREKGAVPPDDTCMYGIQIDAVCYRYAGDTVDTLKSIHLQVQPGEKLAIVGLNGAGKTTLIKCICGLYTPTSGNIKVAGIDMKAYNCYDYYSLFGTVFQDYALLPVSIAEMVSGTTANQMDVERVIKCLDMAGLTERIAHLKDGIHTKLNKQINEDGIDLSGGEKQKLLLARALYKDAPILILDEPTAALDPIAENRLYQEYNEMSKNKTSIFISHRLSSTRFCDRIIYLEDGKIAEEGSHEALMHYGGKYAELFALQSRYYKEEVTEVRE